jgi:hypothetical protein
VSDFVLITARAAAAGVALFLGITLAAAPAYAGDDHTPSPPGPSAEQTPADHETSHEHGSEPSEAPTEPAEVDGHDGHEGHPPPAEPTEPPDRPRAWVFGGFAAVNGVALVYAAWLRRRTAADRDRRTKARVAAQAPKGSSR